MLAPHPACAHIGHRAPAYCDLMVVGSEARPGSGPPPDPPEFTDAVRAMNEARLRPEVLAEPMPAPQRIAPYAAALSADVTVDGNDLSTGRIILLHDPAGNDSWDGTFRCVAYARAEIELEMITDPALAAVGWSWLTEALAAHGASYAAASGTVTRVATDSFGAMSEDSGSAQIEIRASWTPQLVEGRPDIAGHVEAWGELLCTAAGLPPVPEGVTAMPNRRGPSRRGRRGAGH